ncbi:MAG: hypothetical protein HQL69_13645 [Magnetococcales bacterium]|nr:hypothetical protein [Magnetococcales bacterium]
MFIKQTSYKFLFLIMAAFVLSSCSRDAVTDVKALEVASQSCFQASFSLAKSRYPNDFDKINETFDFEVYRCMTWKILGSDAGPEAEKEVSQIFKTQCPFNGLNTIMKKDFVACLEKTATPLVLERNPKKG